MSPSVGPALPCLFFTWVGAALLDRRCRAIGRVRTLRTGVVPADRKRPVGPRWHWAAVLTGGAAVQVLVGGVTGLACAVAVVVALLVVLRRSAFTVPATAAPDLPLALDLLAAALASGAPLGRAAEVVAESVGGEVGAALATVSRVLCLGGDPARAFAPLVADPRLAALGRALIRTAESGAGVAALIGGLAADVRRARAAAAEEAAHRAGVLAVLPLGICFLPGFVLVGIVPVVAGLAASTLRTLS